MYLTEKVKSSSRDQPTINRVEQKQKKNARGEYSHQGTRTSSRASGHRGGLWATSTVLNCAVQMAQFPTKLAFQRCTVATLVTMRSNKKITPCKMVQRLLVPKRRLWIKAAVAAQMGKLLRFAPKTPKFGPNKLSAGHECACLKRPASIPSLGGPQGTHGWVGNFRALFWIFATLAYNICKLVGT